MKLAFAHDHVFQRASDGKLYTGGSFNNHAWKRYLKHFDELVVLAREEKLQDQYNNKTYNNFDLENAVLEPVPSISSPLEYFKNRKEAKEVIKKTLLKSDALIARLPSETGNMAVDIAKELGIPYAVEVVACVWDALWNHGNPFGKLYAPFAMHKMRKRVLNSPYSLYVTHDFLQKRYPTNGKTTNVSNVEIYKVNEEAYKVRRNRISNKDLYKIGMIGSLKNSIKGTDIALQAVSILQEKDINFELYILGDGDVTPWEKMAEKLNIQDKVIFCGVLPGGGPVLEWLDNMDIYIQPSFQEGLPRAVIEAMSRGCPVVGSNAGGIPELIDANCIHKPGDYKALAKKLEMIIHDNKIAMELSRRNLEKSKQYLKQSLDEKREKFWGEFIKKSRI